MYLHGLGDRGANGEPAVQRVTGVLEDDLQLGAQVAHLGPRQRLEGFALKFDPAVVAAVELQDALGERRLAGAGSADQAEGLAGEDLDADVLERRLRVRSAGRTVW